MAITKVGAMTDPPVAGDYAILQAKLDAYAKQIGNQGMILTQWTNTTNAPKIAMGSYISHGGTLFVVDTEDFAVPAPAGDGTYYLKVAASGATLAVSWVSSLAGYTWNAIYNGLYHSDESQILPYQLVKAGALRSKRKITNLMQGSGFVTVDWTGAMRSVYFNQGVKTTDSPTFATINTGHGANELYPMNQAVRTTDSPTFAGLTVDSNPIMRVDASEMLNPNKSNLNISAMDIGQMRVVTGQISNLPASIKTPTATGTYLIIYNTGTDATNVKLLAQDTAIHAMGSNYSLFAVRIS